MEEIREYCAFISYRHKELDKYVAKKVHTMIERYSVPRELRESWGGKRLGKVFRDEEELPVSSNLTDSICQALDHSGFLIVICTPDTPGSIWVEREIRYFLAHHDRSRMVAVLVEGTPETSFPALLTGVYDDNENEIEKVEPLAANLTDVDHRFQKGRLKKEAVRLYAAIMGCPFDSLWQRERRHKLNRMLALVSVLAFVALIYGGSIYMKNREIQKQNEEIQKQNAEIKDQYDKISEQKKQIENQNKELVDKNNEITVKSKQIQAQNEDIEKQNKEIAMQNKELERREAEVLIRQGELLYDNGDLSEAVKSALDAADSQEGIAIYRDDAEYILSRAKGAAKYDNTMRTVSFFEQENNIEDLLLSHDNRYAYTMDMGGYVRCFSIADGSLLWKNTGSELYHRYITQRERLTEIEDYGLILDCEEDLICAFSAETGEKVWEHSCEASFYTDFQVISKDGQRLAVIENRYEGMGIDTEYSVVIVDTLDGSIEKEIPVGEKFGGRRIRRMGADPGVFSEDGKKLFGMVYYDDTFLGMGELGGYAIFSTDLESGEISIIEERIFEGGHDGLKHTPFVMGMEYYPEKEYLLVMHYDPADGKIYCAEYTESGKAETENDINCSLLNYDNIEYYMTIFKRKGDLILFSCEAIAGAYSLKDEKWVWFERGSGTRIYYVSCLFDDSFKRVFTFLTEEGYQHAYWFGGGGVDITEFSDKNVIKRLTVSEVYAINKTGSFGMEIQDDAVELVISATEPKKAYILKPDKDSGYEDAGFELSFDEDDGKIEHIKYAGEGKLAVWEQGNDRLVLGLYDAVSGKNISKYEIVSGSGESIPMYGFKDDISIWRDGKHLTYEIGYNNIGIYDLESGRTEHAFGESVRPVEAVWNEQENGEILHAAICQKDDGAYLPENGYEVRFRLGDGEIRSFEGMTDLNILAGSRFNKYGLIKAGRNGNILAALFSDEGGSVDSFFVGNSGDGSWKVIKAEGKDVYLDSDKERGNLQIVMGEKNDVFAAVGKDRLLRVYDIGTGEVKSRILVPVEKREIASVLLIDGDSKAAIWTRGRSLYLYDIGTGELLFSGNMKYEATTLSTESVLSCIEDPERNRIFFVASGGAVICLSSLSWKRQAEFFGISAYCPETNEIFRIKNKYSKFQEEKDGIIKVKAYTFEDLKNYFTESYGTDLK